jgi:hypothetical protein
MPRKPPIKKLGAKDHAKRVAAVRQAATDAGAVEISPLSLIIDGLAANTKDAAVRRWAQKMRDANPDQYPHHKGK